MIVRRFEAEGKPRWREIWLEGSTVTYVVGVPGTAGVARATIYENEADARAAFDEHVRGYVAGGLVELDGETASARRAATGAPMSMGATTVAEEAAAAAAKAARAVEREQTKDEREKARAERDRIAAERSERIEALAEQRRARREAWEASRTDTWPTPPRWFERIADGDAWGVAVHEGALYTSRALPMPGASIEVRRCTDEAEARSEMERLAEEKLATGWAEREEIAPSPLTVVARRRPAPLDAAGAWRRVRDAFAAGAAALARRRMRFLEHETGQRPQRHAAALARFLGAPDAPPILDLDGEAAAFAMLDHVIASANDDPLGALVDFWVASRDAAFALDVLLRAANLGVRVDGQGRASIMTTSARAWTGRASPWRALRVHLARAPDEVRARAVSRMRLAYRHADGELRCMLALAFPFERTIVRLVVDEHLALPDLPPRATALLASASGRERPLALVERLDLGPCAAFFDDLVDVAGGHALDALARVLEPAKDHHAVRRAAARALGRIVDPRVAELLGRGFEDRDLLPGTITAALAAPRPFVDRVASLAASGGPTGAIALALLTWMLRVDPELRPKAPGEGARRAMRIASTRAASSTEREPLDSEAIPAALRSPPWRKERPPPRAVHALEPLAHAPSVRWPVGLREAWGPQPPPDPFSELSTIERDAQCEELFDAARDLRGTCATHLLLEASPSIALAAWQEIRPDRFQPCEIDALRSFIATYELAALEGLVTFGGARPIDAAPVVSPFDARELAPIAAAAIGDSVAETHAIEWLDAHPEAAAIGLVPIAAGRAGPSRDAADVALFELGQRGHGPLVLDVAARHGDAIVRLVGPLLEIDPHTRPPDVPAVAPSCWDSVALSPPKLVGTRRTLPPQAMEALGELFVLDARAARPEIDAVRDACDASSLAELANEAAVQWIASGAELADAGALRALGHFADDDGARLLGDLARRADDEADGTRASLMVGLLALRASPTALLQLVVLSRRAALAPLRRDATRHLLAIARSRSLDVEKLIDSSIPDFGLDANGSLRLDFGSRGLRVGFDERLEPFVQDDAGERLEKLPQVDERDDPEKADDADVTWRRIKRDVGALASVTIDRLEEAMVAQREIPLDDFSACFHHHPLLGHIAKRLVWQTDGGGTFRIAEDGTLADEHDETFDLGAARFVRVVHPVSISPDSVARWKERFSDYEILEPFPQIDRVVHRGASRASVARYQSRALSGEAVASLRARGFESYPGAGFAKPLRGSHRLLVVEATLGSRPFSATTRVAHVFFRTNDDPKPLPWEDVSAIELSEAIADLDAALK